MKDMLTRFDFAPAAAALAALLAVVAPGAAQEAPDLDEVTVDLEMPTPENAEQVVDLLQRIEEDARDIRESAARLVTFTESPGAYRWLTHAWRLNGIEERLRDVHQAIDRLDFAADMIGVRFFAVKS